MDGFEVVEILGRWECESGVVESDDSPIKIVIYSSLLYSVK